PRQRPLHSRRRGDRLRARMPRRVGQIRARAQDVRAGDRPLPARAADDRAHVARLRDLPPALFQGRVDEEHRRAPHAPGVDGQAVRDRRRLQRRARRGRGARRVWLLGRVPGGALPAQRPGADHLRGQPRGAHDPAGRVRPGLPGRPPGQEIAASIPAGLTTAASPPRLRAVNFVVLSLYWIAIGYLWNSLTALILPDMIIQLVGRENEGTAASFLKSFGTVVAIVWQPIVGGISDRAQTRWGRRRPFIVAGTLGDLLFLAGIALAGSYWWVVVFYFLLQFASNTAQAPYQGLLPDVVPETQRGEASGYYGVANLVGIAGGTVAAGLLLAHFGREAAIFSIGALLVATMLATVLLVPDRVRPVEGHFQDLREMLRKTFGVPLRNVPFVWLMVSRLLIFMGFGGLQNYAFFYFDNVFFHHDRKATAIAASTLLGIAIAMAALVSWPASWLSDRIGRRPLI